MVKRICAYCFLATVELFPSTALAHLSTPPPSPDHDGSYTIHWTRPPSMYGYGVMEYKDGVFTESVGRRRPPGQDYPYVNLTGRTEGVYTYKMYYSYRGNISNANTITVTVEQTPGEAGALSYSHVSSGTTDDDGGFSIQWGAATTGRVTHYLLQQRKDGGSWSTIHQQTNRSKTVSGLGDGNYAYRVSACNTIAGLTKCSGWQYGSTVTVKLKPGPPGPINGPSSDADGVFGLSWTAASGQVDRYELWQRINSGSWSRIHNSAAASDSINTHGNSGTYRYRARACNTSGCSTYTAIKNISVVIPLPAPGVPSLTVPAEDPDGTFTVSWTQPTGTVSYYTLQERQSNHNGTWTAWTTVQNTNSLSYTALNQGERIYQYRVRACNTDNCSGYTGARQILSHALGGLAAIPAVVNANAAGNTAYSVDVTASGSAAIAVPIEAAPGVNGHQPRIALSYSSGRGRARLDQKLPEDILGYGWRLSGFSTLRRCVIGRSDVTAVQLTNADSLCLDGEPLVRVSGAHLQPGAVYRTARESYRRIEIKGPAAAPWFEVKRPDGSVAQYGNTTASRLQIKTTTTTTPFFQWSVNRVTDAFGNVMTYTYHKDELAGIQYPLSVDYGNAALSFQYRYREDTEPVDFATVKQQQLIQLHTIQVRMNNTRVRDYRMMSEEHPNGWLQLTYVQRCGYDESGSTASCTRALTFDWMDAGNNATAALRTAVDRITDGLGAVTELTYDFIVQGGSNPMLFTEQPFGAPTPPANATALSGASGDPLKAVVTQLKRDNGLGGAHTLEYAYQGPGFYSDHRWGFLGFYAQRMTDNTAGVVTYRQRRLDRPYFGRISAVHQYDNQYGVHSETFSRVETAYTKQPITHNSGAASELVYANRQTQFVYEGNTLLGGSETSTTYSVSTGGFVSSVVVNTQTGTGITTPGHSPSVWGDVADHTLSGIVHTSTSDTDFQNDTSNGSWVIGFADSLAVDTYNGNPGGSGVEKRSRHLSLTPVAGTLAVASATRYDNDADNELTTSYDYDSNGNRTSTTLLGAHIDSRTASAGSFTHNRYPTTLTNALGHVTTVNSYDLRFGHPKQVTDPNNLSASTAYDAFGRVVSRTDVNGVTTTIAYETCSLVVCDAVGSISPSLRVRRSSPIAPTHTEYYDVLGRLVRRETEAFSGTDPNVQDIYYDALGRVDHFTLPYVKGDTAYSVSRVYDKRHRVTGETRPDGGSTAIDYSVVNGQVRVSVTETVKRADGTTTDDTQVKINDYDLLGQLVSTTDASGASEAVTTTYTYDGDGNLKTTAVDGGNTTTVTYDAAGNPTRLVGPNIGTVNSRYTALGQLRTRTDNKQQVTTLLYDKLGRLTQRTDADGTAAWTYDPSGAKGLPHTRSNGSGNHTFTETFVYNDSSRAARLSRITTAITVPGFARTYHRDLTYDSQGRLATASQLSGLTLRQHYNSRGYLSAILNHADGQALQTFNEADPFGATKETYGNGVVTTRGYDPQSGRIDTIDTVKDSAVVQDLTYEWRSNRTLQNRLSVNAAGTSRKESFTYDPLNRLTQARTYLDGSAQRDLNYSYNKLGNLLSKTSTVTADAQATGYQYGTTTNAGPHAVSQVTLNGIATTLHYDTNGAITHYETATGPDKFIAYNAANQPVKIVVGSALDDVDPDGRDEFHYDPDGRRYYKKSTYRDSNNTQQIAHTFYVDTFEEIVPATDNSVDKIQKTLIGDNILHITETPTIGSAITAIEYLHRDHLGSVETITDADGNPLQQLAFEPYGARRQSDWLGNLSGSEAQALLETLNIRTSRGYTGHEHLDRTGLIHMNGRVYDPLLGRFLSPDPIVQAPAFSQSWNRYSYTLNNPLSAIDRSGYEAEAAAPDLDDCPPPVAGASWDCEPDTGDDWDATGFNPSALDWLINRDNYTYARRTGSGILYFTYLEAYDEPIVMGYVPLPGRPVQGPAAERDVLARVQPEEGEIAQKGGPSLWDRIYPFSEYNLLQRHAELQQYCEPSCTGGISPEMADTFSELTGGTLGAAGVGPLAVGAANATRLSTNLVKERYREVFEYAPRVRIRGVQDPKAHNFPYSFDKIILSSPPTSVTNSGYRIYQTPGYMNGKAGVFEIGVTPGSIIDHRFFRPY